MAGRKSFLLIVCTSLLLVVWLVCVPSADAWAVTLYSVHPKDSLARIARSQGVTVEQILRANPDLHRNMNLKIGEIIIIPDRNDLLVRADDSDSTPRSVVADAAPSAPTAPPVVERKPAAPPSSAVAPAPAPTPLADASNPSSSHYENVAVISQQPKDHRLSWIAHRRPLLASRRGRLLARITQLARHFIGVPYVWGGTTSHGYDCSGFTMRIYRMVGIPLKRLADEQYYQGMPTRNPLPGDLVFFHTYLPGPSHVGIYLGNNYFIHASSSRGVTISSLNDPYFKRRYLGARRFF